MKIYNLTRQLTIDEYKKIFKLQNIFGNIAQVICIRNDNCLDYESTIFLNLILKNLIIEKRVNKWPGTELLNNELANIYIFNMNSEILEKYFEMNLSFIRNQKDFDFEDLSFVRSDYTEWFVTITHEDDSYFYLTDSEFLLLKAEFPEIENIICKN